MAPLKTALLKTVEKDKRLYKNYDETMFRVNTGADMSVLKHSEKHSRLIDVIEVQDFEGNVIRKMYGRKRKSK